MSTREVLRNDVLRSWMSGTVQAPGESLEVLHVEPQLVQPDI